MNKIRKLLLILVVLMNLPILVDAKKIEPMRVIFETDMGNDVDDALALDMLYKYADIKKIKLLAVMLDKEGTKPAEFVDILNTWYGYPHLPIGIIHNGPDCENDATNYAKVVCSMKGNDGKPLFRRSLKNYDTLPEAHLLYRKLLAKQPDHSVTIIATGFSTNLKRLLDTEADKYSPFNGRELVSRKVARLIMMAGNMNDDNFHEYNVVKDVPAAKAVFETWPTAVVTSPWELGEQIKFPGEAIENDFSWATHHPVIEAYKSYQKMPYDRQTWDLTSVLYAVEGSKWFSLSPMGTISVNVKGGIKFHDNINGNRQYLIVNKSQADAVKKHFVQLITRPPRHYKNK